MAHCVHLMHRRWCISSQHSITWHRLRSASDAGKSWPETGS